MKIKQIIDSDPRQYNQLVHHPLQAWQWGEVRKATGLEVVRLSDEQQAYQMTVHPLPHTDWKIGYLPRSVMPTITVIDFLTEYGKKNKLIFIKIEPYELKSEMQNLKSQTNSKFKILSSKFLLHSPHALFPSWTQILDINQSEDELFKNLKPKTRYNIRLAQKKGVIVKEESNDKGFTIFSDLYFATCKRQKYFGHTPHYHQIVWDHLKKDIAHIMIAYYQDIPLVVYQLWHFKNRLYYVYGGSSEQHRNFMAANLLMWEAIRLGKKLGATVFDMWGSLPPDYNQSHSWAGFTRFKAGYGTQFTELAGSFDLVINPWLYRGYNIVHSLRNVYLSFRR